MKNFPAILLLPVIFPSAFAESEATGTTVPTPEGPVAVNKSTIAEFPQSFTKLPEVQLARFRAFADSGRDFVRAYLGSIENPDLRDYDRAFRAWQRSSSRQHSKQDVILILGSVLGQKLIQDLDMEWLTVTDRYGTGVAVRHRRCEVCAYPFDSVEKRIEAGTHDFMFGVYYAVKDAVGSGRYSSAELGEQATTGNAGKASSSSTEPEPRRP